MRIHTLVPPEGRGEYYYQLVDPVEREARAQRHQSALSLAGYWKPPMTILDVGCGSGLLLAALCPPRALGIGCDIYADAFLDATPRPQGMVFIQADGAHLPFADGHFDLVMALAVIGEFPDWRAALGEMARCVAPGGMLYVTVTNSRILLPLYRLAERVGYRIRPTWWEYARLSTRLTESRPEDGFRVPALAGWRYIHLTPYLICSQWSWLHLLPSPLLDWLTRRFAPSFGFAWQRPLQGAAARYAAPSEELYG